MKAFGRSLLNTHLSALASRPLEGHARDATERPFVRFLRLAPSAVLLAGGEGLAASGTTFPSIPALPSRGFLAAALLALVGGTPILAAPAWRPL